MTYLIPAPYTGMSSYTAHLKSRTPPSQEPGTDYYMDRGTPLRAPIDCRVVEIGGGVGPATGRFITLDDGTRWLRFLHLVEWHARVGQTLEQGEEFALSGSSGYGSEFFGARGMADFPWGDTGGPHVHVTAFRGRRYEFNTSGSRTFAGAVDFHALTGGVVAGSIEEDDMYNDEDRKRDNEAALQTKGTAEAVARIEQALLGTNGARPDLLKDVSPIRGTAEAVARIEQALLATNGPRPDLLKDGSPIKAVADNLPPSS